MKKIKSLALCAVMLFVFAVPSFAEEPCTDGHVPIGTKCFVQTLPNDTNTKEDKEKSLFDSIIDFLFIF